jgi:hypothetical protein
MGKKLPPRTESKIHRNTGSWETIELQQVCVGFGFQWRHEISSTPQPAYTYTTNYGRNLIFLGQIAIVTF